MECSVRNMHFVLHKVVVYLLDYGIVLTKYKFEYFLVTIVVVALLQ